MKHLNIAAMTIAISISPLTTAGIAQSAAPDEASRLPGNWRGESICVAKETACRNETVVYHISRQSSKPARFSVSADKLVDGKAITMGTLEFIHDQDRHLLVCEYSQGVWRLKVDDAMIEGTLTRPDGEVFRRLTLHKEQ